MAGNILKLKNKELVEEITGEAKLKFKCRWCKGESEIELIKRGDKATIPHLEYCPICGMSEEMIKSTKMKKWMKS